MRAALGSILLLAGLAACAHAPPPTIDALAKMDRPDLPGCAVMVMRNGEVVLARGYGAANLEHNIAITTKTRFRIGSMAKQFTGAAVSVLVERGDLSLDDDVTKHLPDLAFDQPVRIRHLLHHTSGIADYMALLETYGGRYEYDFVSDDELDAIIRRNKHVGFEPGSEFSYSNSNYFLLARVVAKVSGQPFATFTRENIFEPLGMASTGFIEGPSRLVPDRADGYLVVGGSQRVLRNPKVGAGPMGAFSTVEDLVRFSHALTDGPSWLRSITERGKFDDGRELRYGRGLVISTFNGLRMTSHTGGTGGFRAQMLRFPDEDATVVALCNRADAGINDVATQLATTFLPGRFVPSPSSTPAANLEVWAGDYLDPIGVIWSFRKEQDKLRLHLPWYPMILAPIGPHHFRSVDFPFPTTVAFKMDDGRPTAIVTSDGEGPMPTRLTRLVPTATVSLSQYEGEYSTADVRLGFRVSQGKLQMRVFGAHGTTDEVPLVPTLEDQFGFPGGQIRFMRTGAEITGAALDEPFVRDLKLRRID